MPKKSCLKNSRKNNPELEELKSQEAGQLEFFTAEQAVVHYFEKDGSLHSGRLVRKVKKGKKKGAFVVSDTFGKNHIPYKIRNIEFPDKTKSGK